MTTWGITFDNNGNMYKAVGPLDLSALPMPYDVVWMPDNTGLLAIMLMSSGVIELRKIHPDTQEVLKTWTNLAVDTGYTTRSA